MFTNNWPSECECESVCVCACYLIDVLVGFDEVNREFPQWGTGRVSETRGDPPLEYGHIRQHLQRRENIFQLMVKSFFYA